MADKEDGVSTSAAAIICLATLNLAM